MYGEQVQVHLAIGIKFELRTSFASVLATISGYLSTEGLFPLLRTASLFAAGSSQLKLVGVLYQNALHVA